MNTKIRNQCLFPIAFAWGLIPLVVRMKNYNTGYSQYDWYSDVADSRVDFFLIYKSYLIMLVAAVMLGMLIYQQYVAKKRALKFEPAFYALIAYSIVAFGSFLFSDDRYYVSHGAYELFEPIWVVLGYFIICYYTYTQVNSENEIKNMIGYSSVGFTILGLIGLSQFLNMDFFKTTIGKKMITPSDFWGNLDQIAFTFDEGTVYATLYNPDWVGLYAGIVLPIALAMIIYSKKKWQKLFYFAIAALMLICLLGAGALGGIIAFMASIAVIVLVLLSRTKHGIWLSFGLIIAGSLSVGVFLTQTSAGQNVLLAFMGTNKGYENFGVKAIETTDEDVVFKLEGHELHIVYDVGGENIRVTCYDENNEVIETTLGGENGISYIVNDSETYLGCMVTPMYIEDDIAIEVSIDGHKWHFSNQTDGTYYYYNPLGKYVKMPVIKDAGIFNNDSFTNRGVIWNHTIPLLKNYILFGNGANTFAQVYPQNDYIYKEYMGMQYMYDVKAHNWYLQQWIEEGLLALISFIIFYMMYLIQSIKIFRKKDLRDPLVIMSIALFVGITSYMLNVLVCDSNVNTAPVFWVAFGLALAVNRMIRAKNSMEGF